MIITGITPPIYTPIDPSKKMIATASPRIMIAMPPKTKIAKRVDPIRVDSLFQAKL